MRLVTLATCNLNQWALDFHGNLQRIKTSIKQAKAQGAVVRVGPELEITGYGCEDHFLEPDTMMHSWECLREILVSGLTSDIVCDIGMPVEFAGVRYNCRVYCCDGRVLLIRPKLDVANDGNYRELRWFTSWKHSSAHLEDFRLPDIIRDAVSQEAVPFGHGFLAFSDTTFATECCEELFTLASPHVALALSGVEIIANSSASHHQLKKWDERLELIQCATRKAGGVYLYSNQRGCDGGRLYFDGCACIAINGDIVAKGSQFSLQEVEVLTACVDLDTVSSYRGAISSFREQASYESSFSRVKVDRRLCQSICTFDTIPSSPVQVKSYLPHEEVALGPACWLWDYLRRSGASGFLLPLSGGADSSSVATIVGSMCRLVVEAIKGGDLQVLYDAFRIGNYQNGEVPEDPKEFASRIFCTVYMGSENSSQATCARAEQLAKEIGASHLNIRIDSVVSSLTTLFKSLTGLTLRYKVDGGTPAENLSLQNIQARIRMVVSYMLASLMPWVHNKPGFLLVLGSSNMDECLRGYLTKYDCSSADINPIGSMSKHDIWGFLEWSSVNLGFSTLADIVAAPPTAELEPIRNNYTQLDEVDMGMTYEELSMFGQYRKISRHGPVSMFQRICRDMHGTLTPAEVATKVKRFFRYYALNRHKMTTLTPSYHAKRCSPEDNRFDLRQFLYNTDWTWQFQQIDELVKSREGDFLLKHKAIDAEVPLQQQTNKLGAESCSALPDGPHKAELQGGKMTSSLQRGNDERDNLTQRRPRKEAKRKCCLRRCSPCWKYPLIAKKMRIFKCFSRKC